MADNNESKGARRDFLKKAGVGGARCGLHQSQTRS